MFNKRLLILNLLHEAAFKTSFDKRMAQVFKPIDIGYDTLYLDELENFNQFEQYTHLLIAGSTESATEEKKWYTDLDAVLDRFIADKKSVFGICFGHQFIVRHLLGKDHVRKSLTPEIGWTEITLSNNPVFNTFNSIKSAVFHYDEVFDLDDRFDITAHSERCAVQGFQVKDQPIWGVQFHPDFLYEDVPVFTRDLKEMDEHFDQHHCQTTTSREEFRLNDQVIRNWIEISDLQTAEQTRRQSIKDAP